MLRHCLNPKVLIVAGVAVLALALYAPSFLRYLPLLFFVLCPLLMGLMLVTMGRGSHGGSSHPHGPDAASPADAVERIQSRLRQLAEEQSALSRQVERLQAMGPPPANRASLEAEEAARRAEARLREGADDER
jgi:hypothetical protein